MACELAFQSGRMSRLLSNRQFVEYKLVLTRDTLNGFALV